MNEHSTNAPDSGDDDLLKTIRLMVSEEAEKAPFEHPPHFPGAEKFGKDDDAGKSENGGPLVLGAMARVGGPEPGSGQSHSNVAPIRLGGGVSNDAHLRLMIEEIVAEQIEEMLEGDLQKKIRRIARKELVTILNRKGMEVGPATRS